MITIGYIHLYRLIWAKVNNLSIVISFLDDKLGLKYGSVVKTRSERRLKRMAESIVM